jgi:hypothetical protein
MVSFFSPLSMMLAVSLSYIPFITLRYIPCVPSLIRASMIKWFWNLLKVFSASIEMVKWFLSLLLLIYSITFIDLCMLYHPCILGWVRLGHGE